MFGTGNQRQPVPNRVRRMKLVINLICGFITSFLGQLGLGIVLSDIHGG